VPNLLKQFKSLLPDSPLLVGEVLSISNNILTIELPDGALITAKGDATVGQRLFVRGGMIEGQAPALAYVEVDI
jgi:hypothetical protein